MLMNSIAWWPTVAVLLVASVFDVFTGRIPNWLVVPFLVIGFSVRIAGAGLSGLVSSSGGVLLASAVFGLFWWLGGMGMGDVKLAASIGAWVGPEQLGLAMLVTAIAGGIMAAGYMLWKRISIQSLGSTSDLVAHLARLPLKPHATIRLGGPHAAAIPYAPAIAIGTVFSFFMG